MEASPPLHRDQVSLYTVEYTTSRRLHCEFICSDCAQKLENGRLLRPGQGAIKSLSRIGASLEACDYCDYRTHSKVNNQGGQHALPEAS
jgi:hypothetical protein